VRRVKQLSEALATLKYLMGQDGGWSGSPEASAGRVAGGSFGILIACSRAATNSFRLTPNARQKVLNSTKSIRRSPRSH
jgi:hypothetical protein